MDISKTKMICVFIIGLFIWTSFAPGMNFKAELSSKQSKNIPLFYESNHGQKSINEIISSWYPETIRWRQATICQEIIDSITINKNDLLELNLFDDEIFTAIINNIDMNVLGTKTISGSIIDEFYGTFIITITEKNCLITISIPEKNRLYITQFNKQNNQYYLIELDLELYQGLADGEALIPPDDAETLNGITVNTNMMTSIDVMIVYTTAAKNWAVSYGGINNIISQTMTNNQATLQNSATNVEMNLVHAMEVSYVESGSAYTDLNRLTDPTDGYMDDVQVYRNQYGADIVQLFEVIEDVGGIGWLLNIPSGSPEYAFSIARIQQAYTTSYTSIHEMGHNMGCHHHKQQNMQPGPGLFSYSAGWRWIGTGQIYYCTVMTYNQGTYFPDGQNAIRVPYFSNPSIYYGGYSTGDAADGDNARTIRETKDVIATYHTAPTQPLLYYTPKSHDFGEKIADQTASATVVIWNTGAGTLTYSLSESSSWVSVTPTSGSSTGEPDTITINIDTTGLSPGSYTCPISISSNGGSGTFYVYVTVVLPTPILAYTPASHDFGEMESNQTKSTTFDIWNSKTGTLSYSLSESSSWVSVTPTSGSSTGEPDTITINIDTTGLSPGSYTCPISIISNGGSGTFTVDMTVVVKKNVPPLAPNTPDGEKTLEEKHRGTYTTSTTDPDGNKIQYMFDWDANSRHEYSSWTDLVPSGSSVSMSHKWNSSGIYYVKVKARDERGLESTGWSSALRVTVTGPPGNQNPNPPTILAGPSVGKAGGSYTFFVSAIDPDGDSVSFGWDWDNDGIINIDDWTDSAPSGYSKEVSHIWDDYGIYNVRVKAKDSYDHISEFSSSFVVQIYRDNPPNKPNQPSGEIKPKVNFVYTYLTKTSDVDGDQVLYIWDWGDGTNSGWLGPYDSNVTCEATHLWNVKDNNYTIKVKAKDIYGQESDWSDPLPITTPYSYNPIHQFFEWLFQRFPHAFPIIRQLLGY
ncbi:Metallo-peptidase family M12B Reprolysin-like protein [uncultured archaeon]|nr:Metallo-peptidase family M12B Reprolysin-like protein [uncultured archaeon]